MKISTKGRYGTRAALELSLKYGTGPVMVREIAESQGISERYLEQILNTLRTADLVKSTRGARGGYELAKKPADITLGDIIKTLEGPFDIVPCTKDFDCGKEAQCITFSVWRDVKEAIEGVLDKLTLEELAERHIKMQKTGAIEYFI